jgi:hypothetical protein
MRRPATVHSAGLERCVALVSPGTADRPGERGRFRQPLHHADADRLDAEQVQQLLRLALDLWPQVLADLQTFERWLLELAALADGTDLTIAGGR